jgi:CBS domain-containing protein
MRLKEFMEIPPITVPEYITIDEAARLMWERNVGSVIVVDKTGRMVGIVTERDVVFSVGKALTRREIPVSSIMSKTVIWAGPNEGISTAVEKMRNAGIRHLPVVDKQGKPMGMISMRDALEISGPLLKLALRTPRKKRAKSKK